MTVTKGESYKQLIARIDEAEKDGFHLEASWIAYAILEDRLCSALSLTGGASNEKGKPITMWGPKICIIQERLIHDTELSAAMLQGDLLNQIKSWGKNRNSLMHSMAGEAKTFSTINIEAKVLAGEGRKLATALCSAVMRLKRRKKKLARA